MSLVRDVETPAFKWVLFTLLLDNDKSYMGSSFMRDFRLSRRFVMPMSFCFGVYLRHFQFIGTTSYKLEFIANRLA